MLRLACMLFGIVMATGISQGADKPVKLTAIFAMDANGGNVRELVVIPTYPIIHSPEISPDGRSVAVDGWRAGENLTDAHVLIVDLQDKSITNFGKGAMPTWSPDGKWIAYCKYPPEQGVYIRSIDGEEERLLDRDGWGIQWSPDGLKAAYTKDGEFVIYDFIGDKKRTISWGAENPYSRIYWNLKWSPDSKRICFKGRHHDGTEDIGIITVTGADAQLRVRCDGSEFNPDIAWHPDGSRVTLPKRAQPGQPGQIYVLDPDKDDAPRPLKGQPTDRNNSGMCWSRDGKTLIFMSSRANANP